MSQVAPFSGVQSPSISQVVGPASSARASDSGIIFMPAYIVLLTGGSVSAGAGLLDEARNQTVRELSIGGFDHLDARAPVS